MSDRDGHETSTLRPRDAEPGAGEGWETLFWLVFDRSSNAILLVDDRRRVVEINDAVLVLLGRSRGETIGTPITDVIAPDERAESTRQWEAFLRSASMPAHASCNVVTKPRWKSSSRPGLPTSATATSRSM